MNSKFINLNHRALVFESVGDVQIKNVEFNNCFNIIADQGYFVGPRKIIFSEAYKSIIRDLSGGVILSEGNDIKSIILENCYFASCGILLNEVQGVGYICKEFIGLCRSYNIELRPLITNITCNLRNCVFKDCFCGDRGFNSEVMRMFPKESKQFNCEFINSPNFK